MGYETSFKLSAEVNLDTEEFTESLSSISDYDWWDFYDDKFQLDAKWYDYDKHMKDISKEFGSTLFKLEGEGEESGDVWIAYYKDGKGHTYRPEVIFPEFKEEDLT